MRNGSIGIRNAEFGMRNRRRTPGWKDFGEGQVPVEEVVLLCEALNFVLHPIGGPMGILLDLSENAFGDWKGERRGSQGVREQGVRVSGIFFFGFLWTFEPYKSCAPGVGEKAAKEITAGSDEFLIPCLFLLNAINGVVSDMLQVKQCSGEVAKPFPGHGLFKIHLARLPFVFILFFILRAVGLVVAGDGREGVVGDALFDEFGGGADEAVAALDVVVEEGQGFPWFQRFEPEADFAEFHGHRVEVHAVEASSNHITERMLIQSRRRLAVALGQGSDAREVPGEAMRCADQEVTGAAGGVTDL